MEYSGSPTYSKEVVRIIERTDLTPVEKAIAIAYAQRAFDTWMCCGIDVMPTKPDPSIYHEVHLRGDKWYWRLGA